MATSISADMPTPGWQDISQLHILYWNVNSVNYRRKELEAYLREKDPHILLISQTCLGAQCQDEMTSICGKKYKSMDNTVAIQKENQGLREVLQENKKVTKELREMSAENAISEKLCEVAGRIEEGNKFLGDVVDGRKKGKKGSKGVVVVHKKKVDIPNVGELITKPFDEQLLKKFRVTTFEFTSALSTVKYDGQRIKLVLFLCIYRPRSAVNPTIDEAEKFCFELTTLVKNAKYEVCHNIVLTGDLNFHLNKFHGGPEGEPAEIVRRKLSDLGFHVRNDYNEKTFGMQTSWSCIDFVGLSVSSPTGGSTKSCDIKSCASMTTPKVLNGNNGTEKLVDKKDHYAISFDLEISVKFPERKTETDLEQPRKETELYLKEITD